MTPCGLAPTQWRTWLPTRTTEHDATMETTTEIPPCWTFLSATALPTQLLVPHSATCTLMDTGFSVDKGFLIGSMAVADLTYPLSSMAMAALTSSLVAVLKGPVDSASITTVWRRPTVPWVGTVPSVR